MTSDQVSEPTHEYVCENCGGVFADPPEREAEARKEAEEQFGDVLYLDANLDQPDEPAVVCHACYLEIVEWMRTKGSN